MMFVTLTIFMFAFLRARKTLSPEVIGDTAEGHVAETPGRRELP